MISHIFKSEDVGGGGGIKMWPKSILKGRQLIGTPGHEKRPGCERELVNHNAHGNGPDTIDCSIWKSGEAYQERTLSRKLYGFMSSKDRYLMFLFSLSNFPT